MKENKQQKTGKEGNGASGRKQRQKMLIAVLILLVPFSAGMYFIFRSARSTMPQDAAGLDVSIPDGRGVRIEASKTKALAHVESEEEERRRIQRFDSDSFSLLDTTEEEPTHRADALVGVREAHAEATRTISGFYGLEHKASKSDTQLEALQRQVEELTRRLEEQRTLPPEPPSAEALMERSYALAARYFPQNGTTESKKQSASVPTTVRTAERIVLVRPVSSVASTLAVPDTLPDVPRNRAFRTAVGPDTTTPTGRIRACIDSEQRIAAGERVRLRLLDRVQAGETLLPEGTIIYGTATISGQRLGIRVQSLTSDAGLLAVNLTAYDTDGLPGLFIPDAAERTALKEAAASAGNNLGSGITVTRGAGQQIASDLTRSLISGSTKYLSTKLREVRITLKAGHTLFLVSEQ